MTRKTMKVSGLRSMVAAVLIGTACLHFWGLYGLCLFGGLYLLAYDFTLDVLSIIERKLESMRVTMRTKNMRE